MLWGWELKRWEELKERALQKCGEEFFAIEDRTDLTDDQKVSRLTNITASVCAAAAIQPFPFADIFVLTPIQAYLGTRIAAVRGVDVSENSAFTTIKELLGIVGIGFAGQQFVIGLYKFIPYWGIITTVPVVYGVTFAIGKVLDAYYTGRSKGEALPREQLREIFRQAKRQGREEAKSNRPTVDGFAKDFRVKDTGKAKVPSKGKGTG